MRAIGVVGGICQLIVAAAVVFSGYEPARWAVAITYVCCGIWMLTLDGD